MNNSLPLVFQLQLLKASPLPSPMIIKCMRNDSDPILQCSKTHVNHSLKLPLIDNNGIQTTRSTTKPHITSVFDSLKYLINQDKIAFPNQVQSGKNNLTLNMKRKNKIQNENFRGMRKKRSHRIHTDIVQTQGKQQSLSPPQYKKGIAEKLLKITQQLGMNAGADYKNYMKTERNGKTKFLSEQKRTFRNKTNPTCETQAPEDENSIEKLERQQRRQSLKLQKINNTVIYVLKCHLKQKPLTRQFPKGQQVKKSKKKSNQDKDMNKSIRGWTKYGRLHEQIQS